MSLEAQFQTTILLLLAAVLSMLIGLDREHRSQPAGLRTHMLVGVGACLITILSIHAFPGTEAGRVAAQIVSGVGFLGAGTIIQRKGLTTAASIWATAGIGMAVGAGAWFLGIIATLLIWIVLSVMRGLKSHIGGDDESEAELDS